MVKEIPPPCIDFFIPLVCVLGCALGFFESGIFLDAIAINLRVDIFSNEI
jgi:hypothetical protein